jgi:hypothetical protein
LRGDPGVKNQRVYRVEIGDRVYKRIVFDLPQKAEDLGLRLKVFDGADVFPAYVAHQGPELWVEFIEGAPVNALTPHGLSELARIFGTLYRKDPVERRIEEGPWLRDLEFDLDFLHGAGVLDLGLQAELKKRLIDWTPASVWIGYDYNDPRAANLIECADGSHRFIDIESLQGDRLLGEGAAKACYRWLGDDREEFISLLKENPGPPVWDILPFVELCSLAKWTRRSVLLQKPKLVQPSLFEALLRHS